jgi:predicted  nucleic acid-binding Zn-ribbon protein
VDRVYKSDLPRLRKELEKLKEEFSTLDSDTKWIQLRIEPVLKHLESLEQLMNSDQFSEEFSRLRKGVQLFHSDLVYFRTNVIELKKILESEKKLFRRIANEIVLRDKCKFKVPRPPKCPRCA